MATVDPRALLQAAMQSGAASGIPGAPAGAPPAMGAPGDTSAAGAPPAQGIPAGMPQGGGPPGAGAPGPGNAGLSSIVGSGVELSQDPGAIQQMVQMLQDPSTPPDQRAEIQMRLQLAALRSLAGGPSGAAGAPQPGAQG
jgi:hypothetical protein